MTISAWGVLGASVVINVLVKGTLKSIGVLMVELEELEVSTTEAAWIPAIAYTLFACLSTPVARLVELTSSRLVTILGGLILSLGVLLASVARLPQLYLGLGVALGAGGCMATLPGVLQINQSFQGTATRGLVHGVSLAGNTLGGLLLPGLLARLVSHLDYQGALMVHSGLLLHIVAAGLFYTKKSPNHNKASTKSGSSSVLKNGRLWCCIFATASTCVGYTNFGLYLPLHLHTVHGLTATEAATFISVFSAGDLIGRILGPALSDFFAPPSTSADTPIQSSIDSFRKSSEYIVVADATNNATENILATDTSIQLHEDRVVTDTFVQLSEELLITEASNTSSPDTSIQLTKTTDEKLLSSKGAATQSSVDTSIQLSAYTSIQSPPGTSIKSYSSNSSTTSPPSPQSPPGTPIKSCSPPSSSSTSASSPRSRRWLWYCGGLAGSGCAILLVPLLSLPQLGLYGSSSLSLDVSLGAVVFVAGLFSGVWCGIYPALLSDELGQDNLHISYPISQTVAGIINLGVPPSLAVLAAAADTSSVMVLLGGALIVGAGPLVVASILRAWRDRRKRGILEEGFNREDSKGLMRE